MKRFFQNGQQMQKIDSHRKKNGTKDIMKRYQICVWHNSRKQQPKMKDNKLLMEIRENIFLQSLKTWKQMVKKDAIGDRKRWNTRAQSMCFFGCGKIDELVREKPRQRRQTKRKMKEIRRWKWLKINQKNYCKFKGRNGKSQEMWQRNPKTKKTHEQMKKDWINNKPIKQRWERTNQKWKWKEKFRKTKKHRHGKKKKKRRKNKVTGREILKQNRSKTYVKEKTEMHKRKNHQHHERNVNTLKTVKNPKSSTLKEKREKMSAGKKKWQ